MYVEFVTKIDHKAVSIVLCKTKNTMLTRIMIKIKIIIFILIKSCYYIFTMSPTRIQNLSYQQL